MTTLNYDNSDKLKKIEILIYIHDFSFIMPGFLGILIGF